MLQCGPTERNIGVVLRMTNLPPGILVSDKVVLFDGECVMCSSGAQALMRFDRQRLFKLGTVQSPEGKCILAWHGLPTESFDTFVLAEGPRLYVRSTAYVRIVSQLSFPWNLASVIWIIPRPIRDWLYDRIARNRFRLFGKRDQCIVLTADHQSRLLSSQPNDVRASA